jgi:hypothetical protein
MKMYKMLSKRAMLNWQLRSLDKGVIHSGLQMKQIKVRISDTKN